MNAITYQHQSQPTHLCAQKRADTTRARVCIWFAVVLCAAWVQSAFGEKFGGIDFPQGAVSFADRVVSYDPLFSGGPAPTHPNFTDPNEAIGPPNYSGGGSGTGAVSLGSGGRIVLQFTDNALTGSDSPDHDLYIFEVGPNVEDTFVEISKDGVTWHSVGKVYGSTSSIDIDAFGFSSADIFTYVRLTDDPNEGGSTPSPTVGADIDAVGAISASMRCVDILHDAVSFTQTADGKGVQASFQPKYGKTLAQAAAVCNVSHFNWVNLVIYDDDPNRPTPQTQGSPPSVPYIDPPLGGWEYQINGDDSQEGHWNEVSGELQSYTSANTLLFVNYPGVASGSRVRFRTYLVGVDVLGSHTIIGQRLEWESTNSCSTLPSPRKNADPALVSSGGISIIDSIDAPLIADQERDLLAGIGLQVMPTLSEFTQLSIQPYTNNSVIVEFETYPGFSYELLRTTNINQWTETCATIPANSAWIFSYTEPTTGSEPVFFKVQGSNGAWYPSLLGRRANK